MGILDSTTGQTGEDTLGSNTTDDWVKRVTEEKGEQWSDPQALAKGYVHAQARIKELEEFEAKAKEQDYAKELLDRLQAQAPASTPGQLEAPKGSSELEKTTQSPEEIQSLIERTLLERDKELGVKSNLQNAEAYLEETFGAAAPEHVTAVAKNLGISKEVLKGIAAESPEAFKSLVGKPEAGETNKTVKSTVNTTEFQSNSTEHDQAYYAKLRRENKSLYMSPAIQSQMIADRMRLGDKW